jgi:hypothetical protein
MSKYWFKKRRGTKSKNLGWGPTSWEGWFLIIAVLSVIVVSTIVFFGQNIGVGTSSELAYGLIFVGVIVGSISAGALISRKKTR